MPRPGSSGWAGRMNGRFSVVDRGCFCCGGIALGAALPGANRSAFGCGGTTGAACLGFAGGGNAGPSTDAAAGFFTRIEVSLSWALVELIQRAMEIAPAM